MTGGKGQLGKEISREGQRRGYLVFSFGKDKLDVTDRKALKDAVSSIKPHLVINCAAYTNVDGAEEEKERAFLVNAEAVKSLSELSEKYGFFLIHYSTDYVFDGEKKSPYREEDPPNPINYYGYTKLKGEEFLRGASCNYLLFRVSWVFGEGRRNFISKLLSWAKKNETLRVVDDQISSPSYAKDLARATYHAYENGLLGLFHMCNRGFCSRFQWARFVLEKVGWKGDLLPAKSDDFPTPARRPSFSALSTEKISSMGINLPPWEDAVERFLQCSFSSMDL